MALIAEPAVATGPRQSPILAHAAQGATAAESNADADFYLKRGEALNGVREYDKAIADYSTRSG